MTSKDFVTKYGYSGGGAEYFGIHDREGCYIGAAYTIDGNRWFIRGLFADVRKSFGSSQVAIEQAIFLYIQEASDRELMAIF
jgi:hypothetical protein